MLKVILYSYASIFQMQNLQDFCDSSRFHIHNIKERNHQNTDKIIAKYCVSCTFSSTSCISSSTSCFSSSASCISTSTFCISSSTSCISSGTPLILFLAHKLSAGANNPLSQIVVSVWTILVTPFMEINSCTRTFAHLLIITLYDTQGQISDAIYMQVAIIENIFGLDKTLKKYTILHILTDILSFLALFLLSRISPCDS